MSQLFRDIEICPGDTFSIGDDTMKGVIEIKNIRKVVTKRRVKTWYGYKLLKGFRFDVVIRTDADRKNALQGKLV